MSGTAPYEVNLGGSDDEVFAFPLSWVMADGTAFPFADYEIEYSLKKGGCSYLRLTQADGITVVGSVISFDAGRCLPRGGYEHGCRLKHIATGKYVQVFTGSVRIGEGEF